MNARKIMTPDPEVLTPDSTVQDAGRKMKEIDVGLMPIVDSRDSMRPKGVITDRDIVIRHVAEGHAKDHPVEKHMTKEVVSVSVDDSAEDVLRKMQKKQLRRLLVLDGDRLAGVIAQADVAEHLGPEKVQETVREISEPARPQR